MVYQFLRFEKLKTFDIIHSKKKLTDIYITEEKKIIDL
jgi:hypothetical protein